MSHAPCAGDSNLRSETYLVALATGPCECCGLATRMLALALPAGHETLYVDTDDMPDETADHVWQRVDTIVFLFQVESLPAAVQRHLRGITSHYRQVSGAYGEHWLNHCEHCGTAQTDDVLHCEPGGAFMPSSAAQAAGVELLECREGFEATAGGYSFEPEFVEFMRRV
jgi:hypothetical protein